MARSRTRSKDREKAGNRGSRGDTEATVAAVASPAPATATLGPAEASQPERMPRTILLVGDDPVLQGLIRSRLGPRGVQIQASRDVPVMPGAPGGGPVPDLVLIDLQLPRTDRIAFVQRLKRVPALADIPIVLAGGRNLDHEGLLAEAVGAVAHLSPPYEPRAVEETILGALAGQR